MSPFTPASVPAKITWSSLNKNLPDVPIINIYSLNTYDLSHFKCKKASKSLVNFWKELRAPGEYVFYKNSRGDWGKRQVETVTIFSSSRRKYVKFIHELSHTIN